MSREIPIANNKGIALVDDDDYGYISKYHWHLNWCGYAMRNYRKNGKILAARMHIEIMGKKCGFEIDHINGNKLDNRRCNLRFVLRSFNIQNKPKNKNNKSGFKGVIWAKKANAWYAHIGVNGKTIFLGQFKNINDAALAYNHAALKHYGPNAYINNILEAQSGN